MLGFCFWGERWAWEPRRRRRRRRHGGGGSLAVAPRQNAAGEAGEGVVEQLQVGQIAFVAEKGVFLVIGGQR